MKMFKMIEIAVFIIVVAVPLAVWKIIDLVIQLKNRI